nr:nucleotidyl transferase AbiEii/AbiGii toxin family protein [Thalassospira marina]
MFAGKLVAALDRQHPRDLFDVRGLLAHEGLNACVSTNLICAVYCCACSWILLFAFQHGLVHCNGLQTLIFLL